MRLLEANGDPGPAVTSGPPVRPTVLVAGDGDPAPAQFARVVAHALGARVLTVAVDGTDEPHTTPRVPVGARVEHASSVPAGLQRVIAVEQPVLTVLGSAATAAHGQVALGGTAERVLLGATRAVAVVPRGHGERALGTIGVGLLPTPESLRALRAAASLSRAAGAPLLVLTVLRRSPDVADAAELAARFAPETPAVTRGSAASILRTAIIAAAREGEDDDADEGRPRTLALEPLILVGDAADALLRATRRLGLLVLGSCGYGPPGVLLPGGTARRVLAGARCPVLITPRVA